MSLAEELVVHMIGTRFEDIPEDTVERAKDIIIDVIGCNIGGANDTGCTEILELIKEWGGKEESTILAHGFRASSHNVALANSVMARSFDYGIVDAFVEGQVRPHHIGETLVPAAVAVSEQKSMGGKELLTALILGEDLVTRMTFASDIDPGWDIIGILNTLGATVVTGILWGLDKSQWLDALGIALTQLAGTNKTLFEKTLCFKLSQGLAAQRGIFSARLAAKGFNSVKDFLMGDAGFADLYCRDFHPEVLTAHLGKKFYTEVTFKPYPCTRWIHAPIDCILEIVHKHEIEADNIEEVTVISTPSFPPFLRIPFTVGDVPHVSAIFNLQYAVSSVLLRKGIELEHFTEEYIRDPQIIEMNRRIKTSTQEFPGEEMFATTVKVRLRDGREFSAHVNMPKGNEIYIPMTKKEKRDKFLDNVRFSGKVSVENGEKALGMLEKLEQLDDITEIINLLVSPSFL